MPLLRLLCVRLEILWITIRLSLACVFLSLEKVIGLECVMKLARLVYSQKMTVDGHPPSLVVTHLTIFFCCGMWRAVCLIDYQPFLRLMFYEFHITQIQFCPAPNGVQKLNGKKLGLVTWSWWWVNPAIFHLESAPTLWSSTLNEPPLANVSKPDLWARSCFLSFAIFLFFIFELLYSNFITHHGRGHKHLFLHFIHYDFQWSRVQISTESRNQCRW